MVKRRASIAISIVHNPYLIFLDEPTSGLDPLARYELWDYLDIINKQYGITLCVISHYLDEIEYCDTACIFLRGIGFYDWNTHKGLNKNCRVWGTAIEITLEQFQPKQPRSYGRKDVAFVIQRGERIRILSDSKLNLLGDRLLEVLSKKGFEVHSIEYKVEVDMIDYFTYVSIMHNTNEVDEKTGEIRHASAEDMRQKQKSMGAQPLKYVKGYVDVKGKSKELTINLVDESDKSDKSETPASNDKKSEVKNQEKTRAGKKTRTKRF